MLYRRFSGSEQYVAAALLGATSHAMTLVADRYYFGTLGTHTAASVGHTKSGGATPISVTARPFN